MKGNEPAFPSALVQHDQGPFDLDKGEIKSGITVRQLYKCFALRTWRFKTMENEGLDIMARSCGKLADAMLREDEEYAKQ